jgi:hypothetical protein
MSEVIRANIGLGINMYNHDFPLYYIFPFCVVFPTKFSTNWPSLQLISLLFVQIK